MTKRSRNTITAAWSAISSDRTWPFPWTWNSSGPAREKCRPPNVCWNGSSPTTAGTSMPWPATACISKPPSSTSASNTISRSWWFSRATAVCCSRMPRGFSPRGLPMDNGAKAGGPCNTGTRKTSPPQRASPSRCGSCTPLRPNTAENASPSNGKKPTKPPPGIGPRRSANGSCPRGVIARGPLAVGH